MTVSIVDNIYNDFNDWWVRLYIQLLTVFVSGTLKQYLDFYNANKDFVSSIGILSYISLT